MAWLNPKTGLVEDDGFMRDDAKKMERASDSSQSHGSISDSDRIDWLEKQSLMADLWTDPCGNLHAHFNHHKHAKATLREMVDVEIRKSNDSAQPPCAKH